MRLETMKPAGNTMKIDAATVEKYQKILEKDPNSQVFAPLAEAYREMGMLPEAQKVVTAGVQRHPQFVGGLVTFARIYRDLKQPTRALEALKTIEYHQIILRTDAGKIFRWQTRRLVPLYHPSPQVVASHRRLREQLEDFKAVAAAISDS